jgi:protein CpxP
MSPSIMRAAWVALLLALVVALPRTGSAQNRTITLEQRGERRPFTVGQRDSLEGLVRARMAEVMKRQLSLTDDQSRKLRALSQRLEPRRRALVAEEREVRIALRAQITAGDSAPEAAVTALIDRMLKVQRGRVELLESEQQELAAFLTPIQRAKYLGLEEQMRLRVQEVQGRPMPGQGPPPGMAPGGMRRGGPPPEARIELRRVPNPE